MRRRDFAVCIALAISVSVVSARTAAADVRQLEPLTANIAARWAFWYVRSHNTLLAAAFGNRPRPINAKLSVPAPGDLRFVQVPGSVTGRILCRFPTTLPRREGRRFSCQWRITVPDRGLYHGMALVTLYTQGGFNVETMTSCRSFVRSSAFCRRYPPPNG